MASITAFQADGPSSNLGTRSSIRMIAANQKFQTLSLKRKIILF